MGTTTDLRREIRAVFLPFAAAQGFVLDQRHAPTFLEFRRQRDGVVHVFDIQWEKYGRPRFVLNFGTCPAEGLMVNGEQIPAATVMAGWLPVKGRLQPGRGTSVGHWFRQDKPLLRALVSRDKLYPASRVVAELLQLFPEIEAWWATGAVGPHLHVFRLPGH